MAKRAGKKTTQKKANPEAATKKATTGQEIAKDPIKAYDHKDKTRENNPPVDLVTPDTDPDAGRKKTYEYNLEIDQELLEAYRGTVSLPFEPGGPKRAAVKILDNRGIQSLKNVEVGA